jgi:hypothetical protein
MIGLRGSTTHVAWLSHFGGRNCRNCANPISVEARAVTKEASRTCLWH